MRASTGMSRASAPAYPSSSKMEKNSSLPRTAIQECRPARHSRVSGKRSRGRCDQAGVHHGVCDARRLPAHGRGRPVSRLDEARQGGKHTRTLIAHLGKPHRLSLLPKSVPCWHKIRFLALNRPSPGHCHSRYLQLVLHAARCCDHDSRRRPTNHVQRPVRGRIRLLGREATPAESGRVRKQDDVCSLEAHPFHVRHRRAGCYHLHASGRRLDDHKRARGGTGCLRPGRTVWGWALPNAKPPGVVG